MFKLTTSRLKKAGWDLTLPLKEARRNDELISLASSQILRWIDELNGHENVDDKVHDIRLKIDEIKRREASVSNRKKVRALYSELDKLQFKPDYMNLVIDSKSDYLRAVKGFKINGVEYQRLLGTNGGIKNSTIVFVSKRLHNVLEERIENGRDVTKPLVTAKLEAYRALTCSASIPVSMPGGVLVVSDVETTFRSDVVYLTDEDCDEPLMSFRKNEEVQLDASDGCGLMLPSLAERWSEELGLDYVVCGVNTRNSYEKGMLFTFDFVDFADKVAGSYIVKDAWGDEVDIRDVEVVLTTSMLKLWDSYDSCLSYLENCKKHHYTFAVTKTTPKSLESERRTNYQFINPYELSDDDIEELISPTVNEIKDVIAGDWKKAVLFLRGTEIDDKTANTGANDFVKGLMIEPAVFNDPFVRRSIYKAIVGRINEAKVGVLKVHGNYSIVSGDPYALCQSMFDLSVTGLLSFGEIYNKYWADTNASELACFRAPMTCANNIRCVKPANNDKISYWYKYMNTCTIFNAWDTASAALNGMDYDGDLVMLTDNPVLVRKLVELPALMCAQRKAEKRISNEMDFIQSNVSSFGNEIGQTTNWITSMFDVRENFSKGGKEYDKLSYRIQCGQLYQQNAIDKAKGIICKPMPKYWHDRYSVNKIEDIEAKEFCREIVAEKKPYFMRYIYPHLMRKYNEYITNTNKKCMREFGVEIKELTAKQYNELTDRQREFLRYYEMYMPVSTGNSVTNRICRRIEGIFDGFFKDKKNIADFDYTIMKSGVEYTKRQYDEVRRVYKEYIKAVKQYSIFTTYERVDGDEKISALYDMKQDFIRRCAEICQNDEIMCDIVLDVCYRSNNTKSFAWAICGRQIIKNLLSRNNYTMKYPVADSNGDIEYAGKRFSLVEKYVGGKDE